MVALVTPMLEDGTVDEDSLQRLVEFHVEQHSDALVSVGTTGESATLNEEEHCHVIRRTVEMAAGRIPIIAGTGANSTREAIDLTRCAMQAGADACLLVTPYYNKPTQEGLYRHHKAIAEAVPIPQILYNVPGRTACDMLPDTVARLAPLENIIGIKDSTGNVMQLGEFLYRVDSGFSVLVGTASALYGALTLGCVGGVLALANVTPETCVKIQTLVQAGDFKAAQQIQLKMIPVNKAVTAVFGIAGLKTALDMLGYFGGDPRAPLLPSTNEAQTAIENILKQAGLLD
jgi:4-hydroxy-tetrahydrodipicolinate synthase